MARPLYTRTAAKLLLTLALLAIISRPLTATCGLGCLSCEENNKTGLKTCKVCDIFSAYVMNSDAKCELIPIENCEVASLDHFAAPCLQCKARYVMDKVLGKCVSIQFASVVADCYRYTSLSTCWECNPDHYLFAGKCIKNETPVENCALYTAEGVCSVCGKDNYLDEGVCKAFPQTIGCSRYSHFHCEHCKPGFSQDMNFYMRQSITKSYVQNDALSLLNSTQVMSGSQENCLKDKVEFCLDHSSPDRCSKCLAGYFVTSKGTCQKYPINRIKECLRYQNFNTCKECESLFYLNGSVCTRRTLYTNCKVYTINQNNCSLCEDDYYLSALNVCTKRVGSYLGCSVKEPALEKCKTCNSDYQIDSNFACFAKKANCVTHETGASVLNFQKCTLCDSKYFLIDGNPSITCTLYAFIPQCKTRTTNRNECSECIHGYYVNTDNKCSSQNSRFCETFEQNKDECVSCIGGFEKDTVSKKCVMTRVDNCKDLSSTVGQCNTCLDGFYKDVNGLCKTHNLVGCLLPEVNKNECQSGQCKADYYRDTTTKQCRLHKIANCLTYVTNGPGCQTCKDGFTVLQPLKTCIQSQVFDANCQTFTSDKCSACSVVTTHFLEPITFKCLSRINTQNCSSYNTDSDTCLTCTSTSFYLYEGTCIQNIQPNCTTPTASKDECTTCNSGFYLDPLTKICQPNSVVGCNTATTGSGFGCQSCDTGWVLNDITKLCEEAYIPNCKDYAANKHECSNCEPGYFLGREKRCYFYGKLGCATMSEVNVEKCLTCLPGFYLDTNDCLVLDQLHCKVHAGGATPTNLCTTCHTGFYEASGLCVKQSKDNCLTYAANTNNCTKCENLYMTQANSCVSLTTSKKNNCVKSNGIADNCTLCEGGYKLSGGACGSIAATNLTQNVPFCLGNTSSTDIMCDTCKSGYVLSDIESVVMERQTGCATSIDSGTYLCTQCVEGWQFSSENPGICIPSPEAYTGMCIQGKAAVTNKTLATINSQSNECAKCRDQNTMWRDSEKCKARTVFVPGCDSYTEDSNSCYECMDGYHHSNAQKYNQCIEDTGIGKIPNCAVYKMSSYFTHVKMCQQCVPGWYGTLCEKKNTFETRLYDNRMQYDTNLLNTATLTGFDRIEYNIDLSASPYIAVKPTVCSDGKTLVVDTYQFNSATIGTSTFNHFTKGHGYHIGFGVGAECLAADDAKIVKNGASQFDVWKNDRCAVAYYNEIAKTSVLCVACKPGYIGEVKTAGTDRYISKCHEAHLHFLEKQFVGLGEKTKTFDSASVVTTFPINFPDLFHYDSCSNGGLPFAFFTKITTAAQKRYLPDGITGTSTVMTCILNLNPKKIIEGCQVYGYDTSVSATPDFTSTSVTGIYCMACRPGWRSKTSATHLYLSTACEPIENCNMNSSLNTRMGVCAQCNEGYVHHYRTDLKSLEYFKCVKPKVDNCAFYNSTTQKCFICKKDYFLNNNILCVQSVDINCSVVGSNLPKDHLFSNDPWSNMLFLEMKAYYMQVYNGEPLSAGCSQCKSGKILARNASSDIAICGTADRDFDPSLNCKKINYDGASCVECNDGYVFQVSSCKVNNTSINGDKCLSISMGNLCIKCDDNYSLRQISAKVHTCVENPHCISSSISNVGLCQICSPGYFLNKEFICEKIGYSSPCLIYDSVNNSIPYDNRTCYVCKNRNLVPYNKKHASDSRIVSIDCQAPPKLEKKTYFVYILNEDGSAPKIKSIPANHLIPEIVGTGVNLGSFTSKKETIASKACIPEFRQYLNCDTFAADNVECSTCNPGYFKDNSNVCVLGQIPLCIKYQDAQTCTKCKTGFFPTSTVKSVASAPFYRRGCSKYTVDCLEFDPNRDSCKRCKALTYLDVTTSDTKYQCKPYSVNNCAIFSKNSDKCRVCEEGSYLDSSGNCVPIMVNNCLVYSATSDTCLSCGKGYYLNSTRVCVGHSIFNCEVFDEYSDKCDSCREGYFKNSDGVCQLLTIEGCATPMRNENKCIYCKDGFYRQESSGRCFLYTVPHCRNYNPLLDQCVDCDESAFFNKSTKVCKQYVDARGCSVFDNFEDKCLSCKAGFYQDSGTSLCVEYSIPNCSSYVYNQNKCTACNKTFYLNGDVCRPVTSINCLTYDPFSNQCGSCTSDYYKDLNNGNCMMYTEQFCRTFEPFENECASCRDFHYLTKTGKCLPYNIQNCENFAHDANACLTCRRGYYLDIFKRQCHPYLSKNCTSYQLNTDACSACVPEYFLKQGKCAPYTVDHCLARDPNNDRCIGCLSKHYFSAGNCLAFSVDHCRTFATDSDNCVSCENGHYFEFGHCLPYTALYCKGYDPVRDLCVSCDDSAFPVFKDNFTLLCNKHTLVNHCDKYSTSEDVCSECILGYYLDGGVCVANPPGIPNCTIYLDHNLCFTCELGYYLRSNVCHQPKTNIVGCSSYSSEFCCETCSSGFALTEKFKCETIVETSCATWSDTENCASCGYNMILELNANSKQACITSGISHCALSTASSKGPLCIKCETGYFLSDNKCYYPDTLVSNCQDYLGHGQCSRCSDNYLLSKDKTGCSSDISKAGSQCMVGYESLKPKCSVCSGGYFFDQSGACQKCSDEVNNCSLCDIQNLSRCLVCQPGYYMGEDFVCKVNPTKIPNVTHASVLSAIMIAFLTLLTWA